MFSLKNIIKFQMHKHTACTLRNENLPEETYISNKFPSDSQHHVLTLNLKKEQRIAQLCGFREQKRVITPVTHKRSKGNTLTAKDRRLRKG